MKIKKIHFKRDKMITDIYILFVKQLYECFFNQLLNNKCLLRSFLTNTCKILNVH